MAIKSEKNNITFIENFKKNMDFSHLLKKLPFCFLKLILTSGLLFLIFIQTELTDLKYFLTNYDFSLVPLSILLIILGFFFRAFSMSGFISAVSKKRVASWELVQFQFVGTFLNDCLQISKGGNYYKTTKLENLGIGKQESFAISYLETLLGKILMILIATFAIFKLLGNYFYLYPLWVVVGIYAGYKMLKSFSGIFTKCKTVYESVNLYKGKSKNLVKSLVFSLLVQLLWILAQYTIFVGFGLKIGFLLALMVFSLSQVLTYIIPSINGIGVIDTAYILLLAETGLPLELIFAGAIIFHVIRHGVNIIGGLIYAARRFD